MTTVILSLLLTIILLIALTYLVSLAIHSYETQKLENLTNQIKHKNTAGILNKTSAKRSFSSFDLNESIFKSKSLAKKIISQAAQVFSKKKEEEAAAFETQKVTHGATNYNTSINKIRTFLFSLFQPLEIKPTAKHTQEIIDKSVQNKSEYQSDVEHIINHPPKASNDEDTTEIKRTATIDYAAKKGNIQDSIFEKMELKILQKLKESGMNNYDIWLELGELYQKYNQNDKAQEVFALILKHASGTTQEKAKNFLIGLS